MPRATSPGLVSPAKTAAATLIVRPGSRKQRLAVLRESANVWKGVLTADEYVQLSLQADRDPYGSKKTCVVAKQQR